MARLAIMEEAVQTRRGERREEARAVTAEERAHSDQISENYRRLMFDDAASWSTAAERAEEPAETFRGLRAEAYAPVREAAPVFETPAVQEPELSPNNTAQRLADYVAYPTSSKKVLFEGLAYKNGELIDTRAPAAPVAEAVVMPAAPAAVPAAPAAPAAVPAAAPVQAPAEDDALPTRRTMDTLRRAEEAATETSVRSNPLAALSLKTKLVLCAVAAAIVLAIVIICINTGLLSSVNADILTKNERLAELSESYAAVQEELAGLHDPDFIAQWAQQNGMVLGVE